MSSPDAELTSQVRTLNTSGAKAALAAAEKAALERGLKLSISVVDNAGNLLAFTRLDGAPLGTIDASFKKARTAALFGAPSKVFEDLLHGERSPCSPSIASAPPRAACQSCSTECASARSAVAADQAKRTSSPRGREWRDWLRSCRRGRAIRERRPSARVLVSISNQETPAGARARAAGTRRCAGLTAREPPRRPPGKPTSVASALPSSARADCEGKMG